MIFCHQAKILLRLITLNANGIKKTNTTPVEANLIFEKHTHRYKDFRISNVGKRNQTKDSAKHLRMLILGKAY